MVAFASFNQPLLEKLFMSNSTTSQWQSIDMLPVTVEKVRDALATSQLTLLNLEAMKEALPELVGPTQIAANPSNW